MKVQKLIHKKGGNAKSVKQQCMSLVIDALRKQFSLSGEQREELQSNNSLLMSCLQVCSILHLIKSLCLIRAGGGRSLQHTSVA